MPFSTLTPQPNDPLLALIKSYAADPREEKIDLGVGVFRDERGATPIMAAVKQAEEQLLTTQDSKSYLGPEGDKGFVTAIAEHLFGEIQTHRAIDGLQTPGGTGALRLAGELLVRSGVKRIIVASPTWANHLAIFQEVGLSVITTPCFDLKTQSFDLKGFSETLNAAEAGDAVLLHGCCQNPLGIDPTKQDWRVIADIIASRQLLPLIDIAYQGLGDGWEKDNLGARTILSAVPYGLLAYSCDKNFGLYRERTGALYVSAPDAESLHCTLSNLLHLARTNWSMPPDHGAAVVRLILTNAALHTVWREELETMRQRILSLRHELAHLGTIGSLNLAPIAHGKGMFATLPLTPSQVTWLREHYAIYMAHTGRINIAGFGEGDIQRFGSALHALMKQNIA
ncbi:amino acid aminotransferase [Neokomagataea thailandica]|uniref:Aromatic amino acid aminotransferase n=1 Tax=Neokomagataea tanensis NBRC 106556 TaxID=1223519 RepID=A0ABQ0QL07_9PROT|nr:MULTISPECIES: aromatic amino acid transaminase [Neokomagataea]GBR48501.1 aromatic amino acid aminotransferase [Neokomagataea tanensis NBRC 106556]